MVDLAKQIESEYATALREATGECGRCEAKHYYLAYARVMLEVGRLDDESYYAVRKIIVAGYERTKK